MYNYRFDPDVIHEQKLPETAHHSRICLIFFDGFHVNYESDWHTAASSLKTMQEIYFFFLLEEANVHTHTHTPVFQKAKPPSSYPLTYFKGRLMAFTDPV